MQQSKHRPLCPDWMMHWTKCQWSLTNQFREILLRIQNKNICTFLLRKLLEYSFRCDLNILDLTGLTSDVVRRIISLYESYYYNHTLTCCRLYTPGTPFANWINFIPRMDKQSRPRNVWDEITYYLQNFNGCTVQVCEWILISLHTL